MRIVVYGAGALGSVVGALLSRRHEVTLVGRKAHVEAIARHGLAVSGCVEEVFVPKAAERLSDAGAADAIIITVKAYDTEKAIEEIRSLGEGKTLIVSLQNGLGLQELYRKAFRGRTVVGVTSMGAMMIAPGSVCYAGEGETRFAPLEEGDAAAVTMAEAFEGVGMEAGVSEDIEREIWMKVVVNSAINPLTALVRQKNGYVLKDQGLLSLAIETCQESTAVAIASGIDLDQQAMVEKLMDVLHKTSENKSSMLQDLEKRRRTEIEEITGEVVARGERVGVAVPLNRTLLRLLRSLPNQAQ